jgi:hypothetical protein
METEFFERNNPISNNANPDSKYQESYLEEPHTWFHH